MIFESPSCVSVLPPYPLNSLWLCRGLSIGYWTPLSVHRMSILWCCSSDWQEQSMNTAKGSPLWGANDTAKLSSGVRLTPPSRNAARTAPGWAPSSPFLSSVSPFLNQSLAYESSSHVSASGGPGRNTGREMSWFRSRGFSDHDYFEHYVKLWWDHRSGDHFKGKSQFSGSGPCLWMLLLISGILHLIVNQYSGDLGWL